MRTLLFILAFLAFKSSAQTNMDHLSETEIQRLSLLLEHIAERDQQCRSFLHYQTLDQELINEIELVFEEQGIEAGFRYQQAKNLQLPATQVDSLWKVQHQLDLENHLLLRGLWTQYGFLPDSLTGDFAYVQTIVLLHPPVDWEVETYLREYQSFLIKEVEAGRMPPIKYAQFVDNIRAKILKWPQIYGTNQVFNPATAKVEAPIMEDLEACNQARSAIGLPPLEQ